MNMAEKAKYNNWEGEVEIIGANQQFGNYRAKMGDKEQWISPSSKGNIPKLSVGQKVTVRLGNKEGQKTWYLNEVVGYEAPAKADVAPVAVAEAPVKQFSNADGQARGNYRTNATNFITHHYDKTGELPSNDLINAFNETLEYSEHDYFDEITPIEPTENNIDEVKGDEPEEETSPF